MENIYFKDEKLLNEKIKKIKDDDFNKLHVVSDFDRTLTKLYQNGKKIPSTVALIREGGYLKDFTQKEFELFDKYHPIEIDLKLPYEYRFKKMEEWWREHEKIFVEAKLNKKIFKEIINDYPNIFRDGIKTFFESLKNNKIPILIFSSGIGDLIEGYLKKENLLTENVHIISNSFEYDSEGYVLGYKGKIIHVMNKSETKINDEKYKKLISERKNVILLGDSINDLGMVSDMDVETIIKIGFLNEKIEENLDLYKSKFDVVITNDGSLKYVINLLKEIENN